MAKCDNCNGTGLIVTRAAALIEPDIDFTCNICEGTGIVDDEEDDDTSEDDQTPITPTDPLNRKSIQID